MKKVILAIILFVACAAAFPAGAQDTHYRARVLEVLNQQIEPREDGSASRQQHLRLEISSGERTGEIIEIDNLNQLDVVAGDVYRSGDRVVLLESLGPAGESYWQVIDRVRTGSLAWLALLFAAVILLVGRKKGLRSLLGLALSFAVIMKFIIPLILAGANPLVITISGSFLILLVLIYLNEGFNRVAHVSILAISLSLLLTGILAVSFTTAAKLTGAGGDELMYLISLGEFTVDFQGLLLAGIIIGTLGVLDDVVISQVSLVRELKNANPQMTRRRLYQQAMKVGIAHIGAMTNTLFLAYAGVALPLLILFSVNHPPFLTIADALNNELIATEIIRTLTGSIGLALSAPLATILAVKYLPTGVVKSKIRNDLK